MTPMLTMGRTIPVLPSVRVRRGFSFAETPKAGLGAASGRPAAGRGTALRTVAAPAPARVFDRKSLRLSVFCDGVMNGSFPDDGGPVPRSRLLYPTSGLMPTGSG